MNLAYLVRKVLQRLREYQNCSVLGKKHVFMLSPVDFLGYVVATDGVMINEEKRENQSPVGKPPTSVKEVQILLSDSRIFIDDS